MNQEKGSIATRGSCGKVGQGRQPPPHLSLFSRTTRFNHHTLHPVQQPSRTCILHKDNQAHIFPSLAWPFMAVSVP